MPVCQEISVQIRGPESEPERRRIGLAHRLAMETVAVFVGSLSETAVSVTFAEAELSASGGDRS